ncbi:polyprotein [Phytophthora megakarya]|uniref:Polyprotein n=1 Tax=Phytophthora megakarya TaxID=4795 RepID=A0A225VNN8_9STRA|nr:polyprotein [Phytophthora megakarya]
MRDGIYYMRVPRNLKLVMNLMASAVAIGSKPMHTLHSRIGHVGIETMRRLLKPKVNLGIKLKKDELLSWECVPCSEAKMRRMTYKHNLRRHYQPLEKISMDIYSIGNQAASGDTIVDEATRFKWAYLLSKKSDASKHLMSLLK